MQFKKPDFGNTISYNLEAIVRHLMGGDVSFVLDPNWPKTSKLTWTISSLSKTDAEMFLLFYEAVAGQEIIFTDHEAKQWRGFIITPQPGITQTGRGCQFKTSFEFEGVRV